MRRVNNRDTGIRITKPEDLPPLLEFVFDVGTEDNGTLGFLAASRVVTQHREQLRAEGASPARRPLADGDVRDQPLDFLAADAETVAAAALPRVLQSLQDALHHQLPALLRVGLRLVAS